MSFLNGPANGPSEGWVMWKYGTSLDSREASVWGPRVCVFGVVLERDGLWATLRSGKFRTRRGGKGRHLPSKRNMKMTQNHC